VEPMSDKSVFFFLLRLWNPQNIQVKTLVTGEVPRPMGPCLAPISSAGPLDFAGLSAQGESRVVTAYRFLKTGDVGIGIDRALEDMAHASSTFDHYFGTGPVGVEWQGFLFTAYLWGQFGFAKCGIWEGSAEGPKAV